MSGRDLKDKQTIFSSLGADPLVKPFLVMEEQSATRLLSHGNPSFSKVISFSSKDLPKSSRQRIFGFLARICRSSCFSNVPQRVTLAIFLALRNDDSNMPLKLWFNSSSSSFGSLSTPEIDPSMVKDRTIFSSSRADPSSKVMLVRFEHSMRRYLRHVNSLCLKVSMCSAHATWRSLRHSKLGSLERTFITSWFSRVLLRVTLASDVNQPAAIVRKAKLLQCWLCSYSREKRSIYLLLPSTRIKAEGRFSLWQVKMRAILSQADLDDALDKFDNKDSKSWSDEERRRDRKALSQIHLHLSNNILQEVLQEKTAAALWLKLESICMSKDLTSKMYLKINCDTLTLNDVCEALQAKEKMKQMVSSDGSASNGEALAARGRAEKKSNNGHREAFSAFKEWKAMIENQTEKKRFWAETASTACYLINRSPSITLDKKTPIKLWSGSPADYSQLRVFGCTAYAHVDNEKLEPRAIKCIFLGYQSGNPQTQKIVLSRNVIFNETALLFDNLSSDAPVEGQQKSSVQVEYFIDVDNTPENDNDAVQDAHIPDNSLIVDDSSSVEHSSPVVQPPQHSIAADRSKRLKLLPPLVITGRRCPFSVVPMMLRLSRILGWFSRRDAMESGNSTLGGVPLYDVSTGRVIDRERRHSCRSLISWSKWLR
ncbi:hypothetical protein U9M48_042269 [Paspalum notatum var. saurae]|uniref:Retroviral polymerase SH3-like domain-containing protein n=1 Tax=Paspalum notatum var. saurae TaxID=547442 RepID=A0AAQ3UQH5_PASNO